MEKARVERRLAAILAADVAGYSRLMGADEEGTLAQLKAHRSKVWNPAIKRHRGYIANTPVTASSRNSSSWSRTPACRTFSRN